MILVTGGAGYIGSVTVKQLLDKGYPVRVYDKLFFGERGLKDVRDKIALIQGEGRQFDPAVLEGVTDIIHLAGLSNDPMANFNPRANYEINTQFTERLAVAAKKAGVKRFIFASSCSIYDLGFHAEDFLRTEESRVEPRAAYAVSKYDAERILLKLQDDTFCPILLRFGTVYGFSPRMRFDLVVNTFVKDALTKGTIRVDCGGEMWRPLIDVSDVAKAFLYCLDAEKEKVCGEVFNLVYKNYRILELAHWVVEALKDTMKVEIQVDYTHHQTRSYRVSGQKIQKVLGYTPSVPVKESIANMFQKIKEHQCTDYLHPRYYNIQWLTLMSEMEETLRKMGSVL